MPSRCSTPPDSGEYSGLIAALGWAVDHDIDVVNMSLGGHEVSAALQAAIAAAYDAGVTLVAASGNAVTLNDLIYGCPVAYPAAYDQVIAVSFTNTADKLTGYSCTGPQVDLAAPGDQIVSTVPVGTCMFCSPNGYRFESGTSMASPHVAGRRRADALQRHRRRERQRAARRRRQGPPVRDGRHRVLARDDRPEVPELVRLRHRRCRPTRWSTPRRPAAGPAIIGRRRHPTARPSPRTAARSPSTSSPTTRDPDAGTTLTVSAVADPAEGHGHDRRCDAVTYTPDPDANGTDTFGYTVSDGDGGSASATVTVTVTPVERPAGRGR